MVVIPDVIVGMNKNKPRIYVSHFHLRSLPQIHDPVRHPSATAKPVRKAPTKPIRLTGAIIGITSSKDSAEPCIHLQISSRYWGIQTLLKLPRARRKPIKICQYPFAWDFYPRACHELTKSLSARINPLHTLAGNPMYRAMTPIHNCLRV